MSVYECVSGFVWVVEPYNYVMRRLKIKIKTSDTPILSPELHKNTIRAI